jgi:hypothetical protein
MLNKSELFGQPTGLIIATVLGRLPLWVLFVALMQGLDSRAFACLYTVMLVSRAYLSWYGREKAMSMPRLITGTLWKHCFRWVFRWLLCYMALFAIIFASISPDRFDFMLLLTMLGLCIPIGIVSILIPKDKNIANTYLRRNAFMEIAIALLWCYVAFTNELAAFKLMALVVIYSLEFLSICKREAVLNAEHL